MAMSITWGTSEFRGDFISHQVLKNWKIRKCHLSMTADILAGQNRRSNALHKIISQMTTINWF